MYQKDLAKIQAEAFGAFARGAIPNVINILQKSATVRRVVDVGCGAGITTKALIEAGFATTALEPSADLLAFAKEAAPGATFYQASAYEHTFAPCDAILALGEPLTYHPPQSNAEERLRGFFSKAAQTLPQKGLLIFDVIVTGRPSLNNKSFISSDDWVILYETIEEEESQRLTRKIETFYKEGETYRRAFEAHHVKLFSEEALRGWLEDAGFFVETAESYGVYHLAPRRLAFFATRR